MKIIARIFFVSLGIILNGASAFAGLCRGEALEFTLQCDILCEGDSQEFETMYLTSFTRSVAGAFAVTPVGIITYSSKDPWLYSQKPSACESDVNVQIELSLTEKGSVQAIFTLETLDTNLVLDSTASIYETDVSYDTAKYYKDMSFNAFLFSLGLSESVAQSASVVRETDYSISCNVEYVSDCIMRLDPMRNLFGTTTRGYWEM